MNALISRIYLESWFENPSEVCHPEPLRSARAESRSYRVFENFIHSKECEDAPKIVSYINHHLQMGGLSTWIIPNNMGEN